MRYTRQLVAVAALAAAAIGGFSACVGDDSGVPDATTPDGGNDATTQDVQTKDVAIDGPTGCAARTADDTAGVFVAKSGSDVNSCGTRSNPCLTITYAIATAKAASGKTTIYVAAPPVSDAGAGDAGDAGDAGPSANEDVYEESVILDAPLTIEGGWKAVGGTWTPICDATTSSAVTIQGVGNTTISASFNGAATLRDLKVISKANAVPSESIYGIFALGSSTNLTLDQVLVDVGAGGAGTDGVDGAPGANATDGGCVGSNGTAGSPGGDGAGGPAGSFGPTGYIAGNGADGGAGAPGHNGAAGGAGACATCQVFTGTCQTSCTFGSANICAQNGQSGCGGGAGGAGTWGTGGGASIGVYVWDAHVTVFGGSFATSNGGNGGNGGAGADGGAPTNGAKGTNANCSTQLSNPGCLGNFCSGTQVSSYTLDGGTTGGNGGAGGAGGHAGGGSGGVTYDFVQGGDGGVLLNGGPTLIHGDGGTGGTLGGANGSAGDKWP